MFTRVTRIGLDIGSKKIKLVKVKQNKQSLEVVKFASTNIPPGLVVGGIIQAPEQLGLELEGLVKQLNLKGKGVIASISGQQIYTRNIEMPRMSLAELKEAAVYQAINFLPIPVEEAAIDVFPLRNFEDEEGKKTEVFFVAVRQQQVDNLVQVCEYAGLKLRTVDIDPLAIYRLLEFNTEFMPDETVAFLFMDNSYASICIFKNHIMIFNRFLNMGLENFLLAQNSFGEGDSSAYDALDLDKGIFDYLIRDMTTDILRSLEYYDLQYQENVEQLFLVGEGTKIKGLAEKFSEALERKIIVKDIMDKLVLPAGISDVAARELQYEFAVALGLAIREVY